jgi:hypothetical protein
MRFSVLVLAISGCFLLFGCQTTPETLKSSQTQAFNSSLVFIDIGSFDNELHSSLQSSLPDVNVHFYEKVSPNNTPERLQRWLNAVERNGGKVDVEPPPGELTTRNPLSLISLLGGLWNIIKLGNESQKNSLLQATRGHDAVISLERNASNEVVISKITFKRRSTP